MDDCDLLISVVPVVTWLSEYASIEINDELADAISEEYETYVYGDEYEKYAKENLLYVLLMERMGDSDVVYETINKTYAVIDDYFKDLKLNKAQSLNWTSDNFYAVLGDF